jgi:long-chain acyl-CoA synthetase
MTRTRKVRRNYVADKYANVIAAFYAGGDEVELTSAITYEDGRTATIKSRVRIEDVGAGVPVHA